MLNSTVLLVPWLTVSNVIIRGAAADRSRIENRGRVEVSAAVAERACGSAIAELWLWA